MSKLDFLAECGKATKRVLALVEKGDRSAANDVLMCEAERIGRECRVAYVDAKNTIGLYLSCAR